MPEGSQDAVLLFNILHCEQPVALLSEAARAVGAGGFVLVIYWRHAPATPRGPALDIRPLLEQIIAWAEQAGDLKLDVGAFDLAPWLYGMRLLRLTS